MEQGLNGTEFSLLKQFHNQMQFLNFSLSCLNGNEYCLTNAKKAIRGTGKQKMGAKNYNFKARSEPSGKKMSKKN